MWETVKFASKNHFPGWFKFQPILLDFVNWGRPVTRQAVSSVIRSIQLRVLFPEDSAFQVAAGLEKVFVMIMNIPRDQLHIIIVTFRTDGDLGLMWKLPWTDMARVAQSVLMPGTAGRKCFAVSLVTLLRFHLGADSIVTGNTPKNLNPFLPVSYDKVFPNKPPLCTYTALASFTQASFNFTSSQKRPLMTL